MVYCKRLYESGEVASLLTYDTFQPNITDPLMVEITEEEYNELLDEILAGNQDETDPDEIDDTEALNIIMGVSE